MRVTVIDKNMIRRAPGTDYGELLQRVKVLRVFLLCTFRAGNRRNISQVCKQRYMYTRPAHVWLCYYGVGGAVAGYGN